MRKLAAIMFTDMMGYSVLSHKYQALALELLEDHGQSQPAQPASLLRPTQLMTDGCQWFRDHTPGTFFAFLSLLSRSIYPHGYLGRKEIS